MQQSEYSLSFAFSPCPNDIFCFMSLFRKTELADAHSAFGRSPLLLPIEDLNQGVLAGHFDFAKISVALYPYVAHEYQPLPFGGAFGKGSGPRLIAIKGKSLDLSQKLSVVVPGKHTTACLIAQKFFPHWQLSFVPFNEITKAVSAGKVDAGIVVHEIYDYNYHGLQLFLDMGELWQEKLNLPLPLGMLVAKRTIVQEELSKLCELIKRSIQFAPENKEWLYKECLKTSQEKDLDMIKQHIAKYVTEDTICPSPQAVRALQEILNIPDPYNTGI